MSASALPDEILQAYLVERFDDFLSLEHGSAVRTREAYRRDVLQLAAYALTRSVRRPIELTPRHLRDFVYHLKDMGLAPSSIRRTVAGLRTWFAFLWLDVPTVAFVGSERDDLVTKINVFPAKVIQQTGPSGSSIHCRNEHW
jgi:hypothetical protein